MTIKVGINGMGRIGRMVIRAIIENQNKNIEIKHINNRSNSEASWGDSFNKRRGKKVQGL